MSSRMVEIDPLDRNFNFRGCFANSGKTKKNTCAFLCSQHAAFIIGQNLVVDGGAINATI